MFRSSALTLCGVSVFAMLQVSRPGLSHVCRKMADVGIQMEASKNAILKHGEPMKPREYTLLIFLSLIELFVFMIRELTLEFI